MNQQASVTTPVAAAPKGRFISFEGGEGVGKSTQVRRLVAALAEASVSAIRTREPGGTPKAEAIRNLILNGHSESWGAGAEAVLFAAARLDHVNSLIAPTLASGRWVVSDRFHDSTRAYQGLTGGVETKLIDALEELALNGCTPELTILLDMDPQRAFDRVAQRAMESGSTGAADRFEKEDLDWHRRLRQAFLDIAAASRSRCVVLNADRSEDQLAESIWIAVTDRFPDLLAGSSA
jgi:dTMP kinase